MTIQPWALAAREAWRYQLEVPPAALHAAPDDSYLLVGDVLGRVRCLDPGTGEVRWEREVGLENVKDLRATLAGPTVLLQDGRLQRLDFDGNEVWEVQVGPLRAGFDATADGSRVAVSAPVHEVDEGEVRVGAEIALWDGDGHRVQVLRVDRTVGRIRFASEAGDLVTASAGGVLGYYAPSLAVKGEALLGSTPEGLVSCLDGSLILVPAGGDGVHVLTAAGKPVGVLPVAGVVEDVDVSENGTAILIKERDGLITLLDGGFRPRWQDRMTRPVLRVDLAADGKFVYVAESTGLVLRLDFEPAERSLPEIVVPGDTAKLEPAADWEIEGAPVRAGLGRLAFAGAEGAIAVLGRPSQVVLCTARGGACRGEALPRSVAHLTADPARARVALWSGQHLLLVEVEGSSLEMALEGVSAVAFLPGGDVAIGSAGGQVRRLASGLDVERYAVPVGAGVSAIAPGPGGDDLVVLCADATLRRLAADGALVATRDLARSSVANIDVVRGDGDGGALEGAAAPIDYAGFWADFARAYQLRATPGGLVVFHGSGRILRLGPDLDVQDEVRLDREILDVQPLGEGLLVVEGGALATVLDEGLGETARFALGSAQAVALRCADGPVILDASQDAVWLRGANGAVLAEAQVYPAPRALAVAPNGKDAAVLLDTRILQFSVD